MFVVWQRVTPVLAYSHSLEYSSAAETTKQYTSLPPPDMERVASGRSHDARVSGRCGAGLLQRHMLGFSTVRSYACCYHFLYTLLLYSSHITQRLQETNLYHHRTSSAINSEITT
jgi:hypothetical protein